MKRLLIALAITNVVTLLGLSVTITLLVVNSIKETARTAEQPDPATELEADELRRLYLTALAREQAREVALDRAAADAAAGRPVAQDRTPAQPVSVDPEQIEAWRLVFIRYNSPEPEKSIAHVELPGSGQPIRQLGVGDSLGGWTVQLIDRQRVYVRDADGNPRVVNLEQSVPLATGPVVPQTIGSPTNPIDPRHFGPDGAGTAAPANGALADSGETGNPDDLVDSGVENVRTVDGGDGRRVVLPDGQDMPDLDREPLPAGVASREINNLLTPEQQYRLKTDWQTVLNEVVFDGVYNPETGDFEGARLLTFPDDSIFAMYGFRYGDVVLEVNGTPVSSGADIDALPRAVDFSDGATIRLERDGELFVYRFMTDPQMLAAWEARVAQEQAERERLLAQRARAMGLDPDADPDGNRDADPGDATDPVPADSQN